MMTWNQRFAQALAVLCGGNEPPQDALEDWLDQAKDSFALQEWAVEHAVLSWAQGIAVIDAASILADQPVEGEAA
jgi:hypothetical protein